ncbi:hypothetical protein EV361DRAFT_941534 [Lentinula raphanica]|uniref:Uncharacterized protein n=1 Tax=Lentinula raphanica TaxID=153919 RepID=A0AA38P016_9AGAR|nr:hypothetical protein F5878DRAFT_632339 [Lentinula raphanica]KAJ3964699.1 hypothetical protein EV361DRAFT_941534 [Lentinula raphanica]
MWKEYIYTFERRDPSPPTISLKDCRAVNVVRMLNQWGKQCGSKEQVLRGWYPGEVDTELEEANDTVGHSLIKGRVKARGKGILCHRLKRLIHSGISCSRKSKKDRFLANGLGNGGGGAPCKDCEQIHKDIFESVRVPKRDKKVGAKKHVDVDYYGMDWNGKVS